MKQKTKYEDKIPFNDTMLNFTLPYAQHKAT